MKRAQSQSLTLTRTNTFYMLVGIAAVAFLTYLFFIGQTVFKLVSERSVAAENRQLSTEISALELETLSLNDTISIERAYELGFVNATKTEYAAKTGELTLR